MISLAYLQLYLDYYEFSLSTTGKDNVIFEIHKTYLLIKISTDILDTLIKSVFIKTSKVLLIR